MKNKAINLDNEMETLDFGKKVARVCQNEVIIYLHGNLGSGKTTFSRGFLQALGYDGIVKSPTYTIVEMYSVGKNIIYHFDFYRIKNIEELELIGIRDFFLKKAIYLVEWPQKNIILYLNPDIEIYIDFRRKGRKARILPISKLGHFLLTQLLVS